MDRNKLRGRIIEVFGTQTEFAKALGIEDSTLSYKLRNKRELTRSEIEKWCDLLEIPAEKIHVYFFTG